MYDKKWGTPSHSIQQMQNFYGEFWTLLQTQLDFLQQLQILTNLAWIFTQEVVVSTTKAISLEVPC